MEGNLFEPLATYAYTKRSSVNRRPGKQYGPIEMPGPKPSLKESVIGKDAAGQINDIGAHRDTINQAQAAISVISQIKEQLAPGQKVIVELSDYNRETGEYDTVDIRDEYSEVTVLGQRPAESRVVEGKQSNVCPVAPERTTEFQIKNSGGEKTIQLGDARKPYGGVRDRPDRLGPRGESRTLPPDIRNDRFDRSMKESMDRAIDRGANDFGGRDTSNIA